MGASSWHYTTAYDPDAEHALQQLREQVFANGAYCRPGELPPAMNTAELRGLLPWKIRVLLYGLRVYSAVAGAFRWMARGGRRPRSIEEVLEDTREDGTYSILDIAHTADRRTLGAAAPLSAAELRKHFGTLQPTLEQAEAEAVAVDIAEELDRWEAVYFVVYQNGQPLKYVFVGCSGD